MGSLEGRSVIRTEGDASETLLRVAYDERIRFEGVGVAPLDEPMLTLYDPRLGMVAGSIVVIRKAALGEAGARYRLVA